MDEEDVFGSDYLGEDEKERWYLDEDEESEIEE